MKTRLDLYQRVTPLAGLGIWERNLVTQEFYWNSIIREIFEVDHSFQATLEESLQFYQEPDYVRQLINKAIELRLPQCADLAIKTAKGNNKWVRVRINADYDEQQCINIYGTLEDITKDIELLYALAEEEQRFASAFDHAPIGMALVSPQGRWIKANPSLCSLIGYTEAQLSTLTFQELTHPDDLNADLEQMNDLLRGVIKTYSMEKRYYNAAGNIIWAQLNVSLVRNSKNTPLYFVAQIKDITERKRYIETIRSQNERLLNFAHIISHNLRSHTGNIRMLSSMIQEEENETEKTNLLRMLDVTAKSMLETLTDLNTVVQIHDNPAINIVEINVKQQLEKVMDILGGSLKSVDGHIEVKIPDNFTIRYHPAYLESILLNLLTNSIKYRHPDRPLYIEVIAETTTAGKYLSVTDNGLGIDLELHGHKLFGMYKTFHQHKDARGLGLFLVKNHVEAMNGKIHAESTPDKGTKFIIEINIQ